VRKDDNDIRPIFQFLGILLNGFSRGEEGEAGYIPGMGGDRGLVGNNPNNAHSYPIPFLYDKGLQMIQTLHIGAENGKGGLGNLFFNSACPKSNS
jgi:hypothetical protein